MLNHQNSTDAIGYSIYLSLIGNPQHNLHVCNYRIRGSVSSITDAIIEHALSLVAARGSWLVARGSWLVARGLWLVARVK